MEQLSFSIGEVSEMTGVEPYVLRYWESEFKILHPSKRHSGQRSYQQKDIDTILRIKQLLYDDLYSIAGAKKKLKEPKAEVHAASVEAAPVKAADALPVREDLWGEFLKEIREELMQLKRHCEEL